MVSAKNKLATLREVFKLANRLMLNNIVLVFDTAK